MDQPPINRPTSLRVAIQFIWRRLVPPISREQRGEVRVLLREASSPDFSYFLLVVLSSIIATLGLLTDSAATIIGAMLVAPLMSPIIGFGLGSITGDGKLVRDAASALARGALLAGLVAFLLTWVNRSLPFIALHDLPGEVLARVHPTPLDLGVALAGGLAAAFAMAEPHLSAALPGVAIATALMPPLCTIGIGLALGRWDIAGGASLLFVTNSVTIAFASSLVFFALGFSPRQVNGDNRLPRSLLISALLTALLLAPLTYLGARFVRQANETRKINFVVARELSFFPGTELIDLSFNSVGDTLEIEMTVQTISSLGYDDVTLLQQRIATALERTVRIKVKQINAIQLDPLIPPTKTPTITQTSTHTPGPSPSPTLTPTRHSPTAIFTPSATASFTPTPTLSATPSPSPTPYLAQVANTFGRGVHLRQSPEGPSIAILREGDLLTILSGYEILRGIVWVEAMDAEGRIGWLPLMYLIEVTPTSIPTPTHTAISLNPPTATSSLTSTP
jgi:uncharacterized hydrophobic protein (TIGR00271 family)